MARTPRPWDNKPVQLVSIYLRPSRKSPYPRLIAGAVVTGHEDEKLAEFLEGLPESPP